MGISIKTADKEFEIGSGSFLRSFFSTILIRLENQRWGSRFPVIMNELYSGKLPYYRAGMARAELVIIREAFCRFSPSEIVWDYEDPTLLPPWEDNISPSITSLSNYFVTSVGKDLFEVLYEALSYAQKMKQDLLVS